MKSLHAKLAYDRLKQTGRLITMYNEAKSSKNQHGTSFTFRDGSVLLVGKKIAKWKTSAITDWIGERAI